MLSTDDKEISLFFFLIKNFYDYQVIDFLVLLWIVLNNPH